MDGINSRRPTGQADRETARADLTQVKDALNADPASALAYIMPTGYISKREFRCGDVFGTAPSPKGGSFSFNLTRLIGADFADLESRGYFGVYDVYVAHCRGDQRKAIDLARAYLGLPEAERPKVRQDKSGSRKAKPTNWIETTPPADAPAPNFRTLWGGAFKSAWPYRDTSGNLLFFVARYEKDGRKDTPAITYGHTGDGVLHWRAKGGKHVLFGLELLAGTAEVWVFEGEKTASAARDLFPGIVCLAWRGGDKAIRHVDFSPLAGMRVRFIADADRVGAAAMQIGARRAIDAGAQAVSVTTMPGDFPDGWDVADAMPDGWTVERIRALIEASDWNGQPTPPGGNGTDRPETPEPVPYWPATDIDAATAYAQMQAVLEDWFAQAEAWADARDYDAELRAELITDDMTKRERRDALHKIDRRVAERFPGVNVKRPPRLQIAAAAGLGKSSGVRDAYLRRIRLWDRQVHVFAPTVALARGFEDAMNEAMRGLPQIPLVVLHRGRDHEAEIGNAPCVRWRAGRKLVGKVPSLFSAMCKRGESICPHYTGCAYIRNYMNQGPGMHLFVHDHLTLSKPLNFPKADLAIIDEDATETLLAVGHVPASVLSEPATYQTAAETDDQDVAAKLGTRLLAALVSGAPLLAAVRDADISFRDLKTLAHWAEPIDNGPDVSPSMSDKAIEEAAEKIQPQNGEFVGRIVRQIARELRHDRDDAHGVEYRDGVLHLYRKKKLSAVPKGIPLLIIDADANLETNRRLYGDNLVGMEIKAQRLGKVTQVHSTALAKSYLAPEVTFGEDAKDFQVERAQKLRQRIQSWLTGMAAGGKLVLVITNKPVRLLFTGEKAGKVPVSVDAHGVTWTHYGAVLGVDSWKHYDAVVLIGREQMSDSAALQQTRAIYCDDPEPLNLSAKYRKVTRCHRMRDGSAFPVTLHEHEEPRAQVRVEAARERGMGQAIDRLRLIHGRADREVFILCNIPVPGIEVDRMVSLDELLAGGSALERLVEHARLHWGVLPLVADFLVEHAPNIAPSRATAERLIAKFKTLNLVTEYYYDFEGFKSARFWRLKQKRPSVAAFLPGSSNRDSIAALERLFGPVTVQVATDADDRPVAEHEPATDQDRSPILIDPTDSAPVTPAPIDVIAEIQARGNAAQWPVELDIEPECQVRWASDHRDYDALLW